MERFLSEDGRHGIIRFLEESYELLHYYDNTAVAADVLKHIHENGGVA